MSQKHQAAILPQTGGPLAVVERATPEPGPGEVLIETKAIAVNPVDYYQRDFGFPPVPVYPAIVGSDVAGLVVKVGTNVTNGPPVGSRVTALASSYYQNGSPDHGAFQKYVLAPAETVVELPNTLSFEEGAICPLAVLTALSGWTTIGLSIDTSYAAQDKQAVLIWGGASSVGSFVVQSAHLMGFRVYVTAGHKNHEYMKKLGADVVFDYSANDVVTQIVDTVHKDGVTLRTAYGVVDGSLQPTLDILKSTKGDKIAKVAYAPPLLPGAPTLEGVETTFVQPPADATERKEHMYKCFHGWLRKGLTAGTVVPSPRMQVEAGGLQGLNKALDTLKAGVSGTKIVVQV